MIGKLSLFLHYLTLSGPLMIPRIPARANADVCLSQSTQLQKFIISLTSGRISLSWAHEQATDLLSPNHATRCPAGATELPSCHLRAAPLRLSELLCLPRQIPSVLKFYSTQNKDSKFSRIMKLKQIHWALLRMRGATMSHRESPCLRDTDRCRSLRTQFVKKFKRIFVFRSSALRESTSRYIKRHITGKLILSAFQRAIICDDQRKDTSVTIS